MNGQTTQAPRHLWIVGILAVLWNAIGAFDYSATQLRLDWYMGAFPPEQLEYFYGFPAWSVAAWAFGVWGAFLGSIALLLRKAWAVWLFGASIAGLVVTTLHNFVLTDGAAIMGAGAVAFSALIWVIALCLFFYARAMARRGVLA
jgi:hypothetical protein